MTTDRRPAAQAGFFAGLVRRPVTLFVLFVTFIVVGVLAYLRIPLQMMPDGMQPQSLRIFVTHPGSSPEENEARVARPLEEQLRTISGVNDITSTSNEDFLTVRVQFGADQDTDLIKAEVRDRIERARPSLPTTVDRIRIFSWSQSELPLMWLAVLAKEDSRRTDYLMDAVIQRRLDAVDGVGQTQIWGMLDDSVRILLDEDRVAAANLDLGALIQRLSSDNFAMPMGEIEDGGQRLLLRSDMRFADLDQIRRFPIAVGRTASGESGAGSPLVLGDIGRVIEAKSVRDSLARINGSYAYWGVIRREGQANVVATCHGLHEAFEELRTDPRLAGEFDFMVMFDQGQFIESALGQLRETALWGGGLALVVLLAFLRRVRLTLCVALSIPLSVLLSIAWTYFAGGTFNVLTMTGITLALGMLVDNSVVVIENISRLAGLGFSRREAAVAGARDVGLAVSLATLTTVVVFLPLIFMTSNPDLRVIFGELGRPLCLALLFSLLVALTFLPVAAVHVVGPRAPATERLAGWLAPLCRIPARLACWLLGGLRAVGFGSVVALFAVERALLAVIAPLRYALALGVVGFTVWRARALLAVANPAAELERIGAAPPGAGLAEPRGILLSLGVPAALAVGLLLATGRWRRRLAPATPAGAKPTALAGRPRRPTRFVPGASSLLELAANANRGLVGWSLEHRFAATCLALAAALTAVVPMKNMEVAAFGQDEQASNVELSIDLQSDFTLAEASAEFERYERFFEARREAYGFASLATMFDLTGGEVTLWWDDAQDPAHIARIEREIRAELPRFPGHAWRMGGDDEADEGSRLRTRVVFRLTGPDPDELERLGEQALERLEGVAGLSGLTTASDAAPEQVRLVFDPELSSQLGVSANVALQNISWALRGWSLPRFHEEGREIPLILEYDEEEVAGLDTLRDLAIWTGQSVVPLSSVASFDFARGSRSIYRRNGKTTFTITGRVDDPTEQQAVSAAGYAALASLELPRGYAVGDEELSFRRQEMEMTEIKAALSLSVVLVFLLMGILFESFLLPFSVLFTIPFAVVGALWTLYLTGTVMDSVGWIGIIILVGVVVNNGIVLIDRIHRLRGELPRTEAVIEGAVTRVRPILMTAMTTVFGLLPMALTRPSGEGIDYRALATCVAGGLTIATFFTLWVVPLAYTVLDDLGRTVATRVRWSVRPAPAFRLARRPAHRTLRN